jgi:hypothetical protein
VFNPARPSIELIAGHPQNVNHPLIPSETDNRLESRRVAIIDGNADDGSSVNANDFADRLQT